MKKIFLFALFLMYGCRTYDPQLVAEEYKYDTSKLAENYNIYENESDKKNQSLEQNKKYYIVMGNCISTGNLELWQKKFEPNDLLIQLIRGVLVLAGVPYSSPKETCNMTASIFNRNNVPIKTLTTEAEDREFAAMYYGYEERDAIKKAENVACYKARNDIYKQLEKISLDELNNLDMHAKARIEKEQKEKLEQKKRQQKIVAENKRKAENRRKRLTEKYGKATANAIMKHKIIIGMSESALRESWGMPMRIGSSVGSWGTRKQYNYWNHYGHTYVYIENGVVKSWNNVR